MQKKINFKNRNFIGTILLSIFLSLYTNGSLAWAASPEVSSIALSIAAVQAEIQRGRETGEVQYFERAERMLDAFPQKEKNVAKVLGLRAWIALFQHRFQSAVVLAKAAHLLEPTVAFYEGLLSDAYLELGEYDKAVTAAQGMLDLRPDQAALSRAAHLRSLHGDPEGAIDFWQHAIESGGGSPENTAWCQVELGDEYFHLGKGDKAEETYRAALETYPDYRRAFEGLGRLAAARDRNGEALIYYRKALAVVPALETAAALGEVHLALGNKIKAQKHFALVEHIAQLNRLNSGQNDRALALFYTDHDRNIEAAIRIAEAEASLRKDIHGADILGWAYFKAGRFEEAHTTMQAALRTGSRHSLIHFHAGMIAHALGQESTAVSHLDQALKQNPNFHSRHAATARKTLKHIRSKGGHS